MNNESERQSRAGGETAAVALKKNSVTEKTAKLFRAVFVEFWGLKIFSAAFAVALWIFLTIAD